MKDLNSVALIGRLTRDPDVKDGGTKVARFTLAVNRGKDKNGEEKADFVSCVAFGTLADIAAKYCTKGKQACVYGAIRTGSYEKDGHTVYTTDVFVNELQLLDAKGEKKPDGIPSGFEELNGEVLF